MANRSFLTAPISLLAFLALILAPSTLALRVPSAPLILPYHNGPLLTGDEPIKIYATFYGTFTDSEKSTLKSFLASFTPAVPAERFERTTIRPFLASVTDAVPSETSTVAKWWSLTRGYSDSHGKRVPQEILLKGETIDNYSRGKFLKDSDIVSLVESSLKVFPVDMRAIYLVFTAADVYVEGFCMHTCGRHSYTQPLATVAGSMLPYAWVGNSKSQCPGFCAWPFAKPEYGPKTEPLKAPNGVGVDGMIITLAKVLAGAATNPFGTAYYQGDASNALEAAGACGSKFGNGAYPGYPGELLKDAWTGASYNVEGLNQQKFLVPWMWNPATLSCSGQTEGN